MAGRGRPCAAAPVARVVLTHIRGRFGEADRGRHRRRGPRPRCAAGIPHQAPGPPGARGPPAPGRLARGDGARGIRRSRGRADANRLRAAPETVEKINTKEISMDLMEITEKERLSREDAAARLHALADALARHNEVEFERGGLRFTVHVPDEVDFKLEIEIGDDERELEIEL